MGADDGLRRGRDLAGSTSGSRSTFRRFSSRASTLALKIARRACRIRPAGEPAGTRDHRGGPDPRRRGGACHPASASRHRRAHRARRFRHRLFLAELSAALPVRQDQDRPLLRQRHRGNRRLLGDRAGGGEHRRRAPHDDDGGRRRDARAKRNCCARSAAPRCRAICSARPSPPPRSGNCCSPTARDARPWPDAANPCPAHDLLQVRPRINVVKFLFGCRPTAQGRITPMSAPRDRAMARFAAPGLT